MSGLSRFILRLFNWELEGEFPQHRKAIFIMAPHTSLFDFVIGRLYLFSIKKKAFFLISSDYFFFPLGIILKSMGGIAVSMSNAAKMVSKAAETIKNSESIYLAITPEATLAPVAKWKRGFYHISQRAGVPVFIGYLDYERKRIGIGPVFEPSGDIEADMIKIKSFYNDIKGRHPEKFLTGLEKKSL